MTLTEAVRQATAHWSHPDWKSTPNDVSSWDGWDGTNNPPACRIDVVFADRPGLMAITVAWTEGGTVRTAGEHLITDALATMGRLQSWAELMGMPDELVAALTEAARLMEVGP